MTFLKVMKETKKTLEKKRAEFETTLIYDKFKAKEEGASFKGAMALRYRIERKAMV